MNARFPPPLIQSCLGQHGNYTRWFLDQYNFEQGVWRGFTFCVQGRLEQGAKVRKQMELSQLFCPGLQLAGLAWECCSTLVHPSSYAGQLWFNSVLCYFIFPTSLEYDNVCIIHEFETKQIRKLNTTASTQGCAVDEEKLKEAQFSEPVKARVPNIFIVS